MLPVVSETLELADGVGRGAEHGGGGGFFIFPLLLLILLGFLLFRIARRGRHGAFAMAHGGAMNTLGERFARGDISREEYEYRRAILSRDKDVPPAPPFAAPPRTEPSDPGPGTSSGPGTGSGPGTAGGTASDSNTDSNES